MALTALNHKKIGDVSLGAASIAGWFDALYDALTAATYYDSEVRTAGVGSAVKNVTKEQETGTTVCIHGEFVSADMAGWKWAFAGGSTVGKMIGPETNVGFGFTIIRNAGAYADYKHATAPFTTGDFPGYWALGDPSIVDILRVYESQETLWVEAIDLSNATEVRCAAVGALWDPDSTDPSDSESNGRRIGLMCSSEKLSYPGAMHTTTTAFLGHWESIYRAHAGALTVGGDTIVTCSRCSVGDPGSLILPSGQAARLAHISHRANADGILIGQLRDVQIIGHQKDGLVAESAGADVGYVIGQNHLAADDAILLQA
jgi:hypothetical protein